APGRGRPGDLPWETWARWRTTKWPGGMDTDIILHVGGRLPAVEVGVTRWRLRGGQQPIDLGTCNRPLLRERIGWVEAVVPDLLILADGLRRTRIQESLLA